MRISTTQLESFRLFIQPDNEWMTEASLIETLKGIFTPNDAILLGLAWGSVLESPNQYAVDGGFRIVPRNGAVPVFFRQEDVERACAAGVDHRIGVFEAKAVKRYGSVDVVSKADQITGARLWEFKATTGTFDPEKYLASCQWRYMVDAFEPSLVTYLIFEWAMKSRNDQWVTNARGEWAPELWDVHAMNCYPYPGLSSDCAALVRELQAFIQSRDLAWLFERRQALSQGDLEWVA